jgi:hypothetical protein
MITFVSRNKLQKQFQKAAINCRGSVGNRESSGNVTLSIFADERYLKTTTVMLILSRTAGIYSGNHDKGSTSLRNVGKLLQEYTTL